MVVLHIERGDRARHESQHNQLDALVNAAPLAGVFEMIVDRCRADPQHAGDLFLLESLPQQFHDFTLPGCELAAES